MLLANKNAVIYGAGGAIGGAVARAFAGEGARLYLAGRSRARLHTVASGISASGASVEVADVDASDESAVEKHVGDVAAKAGRIDILFNAIGMEDVQGSALLDMPVEDFLRPVVKGARTQFLTARAVGRVMAKQGSGVLMTVTGGPAREATTNIGGYGAACEAIEGLWRGLSAELGPYGVRVICLRSAGSPDAPDMQEVFRLHAAKAGVSVDEFMAGLGRNFLLGRLPALAEVADVATMMASDRARAMTGSFINVTCGSRVE
jgi:3-oxoacyl-[acyl-carrier protein] reductase